MARRSGPELELVNARGKRRRLAVPVHGFRHDRQGNLTLVRPEASKTRWTSDELAFRSLVFDRDGKVASVGLPKFFEPHQQPGHVDDVEQACADGDVPVAHVKLDGALIIRSVIRGKVHLRTRAALSLADLDVPVRALAARSAALMDPTFAPTLSLQLEFTSPAHRVVLAYPEDALTVIGATDHRTLLALPWPAISALAADAELPLPESVDLRGAKVADWLGQLGRLGDVEGVVVRWQQGARMLRLKTDDYRIRHRLRFTYPPRRLAELQAKHGESGRVLAKLAPDAADVDHLHARLRAIERCESEVEAEIAELRALAGRLRPLTRREQRERAGDLADPAPAVLAALLGGDGVRAEQALRAHRLNRLFEELDALTAAPLS